jgi:hypothetical protein
MLFEIPHQSRVPSRLSLFGHHPGRISNLKLQLISPWLSASYQIIVNHISPMTTNSLELLIVFRRVRVWMTLAYVYVDFPCS